MAAPKGVGAVEAYKTTKSRVGPREVGVAEFMPKASPAVEDQAARLAFQAAKNFRDVGFGVERSAEVPGLSTPAGGPKGGRKSRRRRRGGAMTKPLRELIADLERDPSKATLENVISDLKASGNRAYEDYGASLEIRLRQPLRAGETMDERVRATIEGVVSMLRMAGRGRRRKTTRRRK